MEPARPFPVLPARVRRVTPRDGGHFFFGYYDKCPWSADGRRLLAGRAPFQDRPPTETDRLTLGAVDLASGRFEPFAETTAWNWQQGTMLQWLPDGRVFYNGREDGRPAGVIHDLATGRRRILPVPVYAVHPNGQEGVTLDFHRLQAHRPGYGYPPAIDGERPDRFAPDDVGLWRVEFATGRVDLLLSLAAAAANAPDATMAGRPHWLNHATYAPGGARLCFLHRWKCPDPATRVPWRTRFYTVGADGSAPFLLNASGMTSHFAWRDPAHLVAWTRVPRPPTGAERAAYYVLRDGSAEAAPLGEGVLALDGHMSYSPDGRWLLTDEYPGRDGKRPLLLFEIAAGRRIELGRFLAPPALAGELRCDLHPRWNADGREVCFDSAHEGERAIYVATLA